METRNSLGIVFSVILRIGNRYESFTFMNDMCNIIKELANKNEYTLPDKYT